MKSTIYTLFTCCKSLVVFLLSAFLFYAPLAQSQTYRIAFPTAPPTDFSNSGPVDQNDTQGTGIETGIKFYVTQPGTITGIFFLRSTFNLGSHVGHIWDNSGNLLLTSAPMPEVGNGFQEVTVSLHINSNTIYVASVFNNIGDYAVTNNSFPNNVDYGTNPIKIVANDNTPTGNGVYVYTGSATFPTNSFDASNYWIDIRFQPDFLLPVSLSDFKATAGNNNISLSWKTDHEFNNKGFEIQRSNNGTDWYPISFINGTGTSDVSKSYSYIDKSLAPGTYFYRLNQMDLDGKSSFSSIASATISGKGAVSLFQNYPNPFNRTTTIRFDLPRTQHARLSVMDLSGREITILTDRVNEAGSHIVTLDASRLAKQTYLVKLQTEGSVLTKKIVVK